MASDVDICNLALARLGDAATVASIDPPEGSAQAEHCASFYPIARDALLELHPWKFAVGRVALAPLQITSWSWQFAYAAPAGLVKLLAVLPVSAASDSESVPFEVETSAAGELVVLTNQSQASARYVRRVTDTSKFSPLFTDALAWLLASYLAGPVLKGELGAAMARSCYQSFLLTLSQARTSDGQQRKVHLEHTPAWVAQR